MRKILLCIALLFCFWPSNAQFIDCMNGLLIMPSAEMDDTGTVKITNNFLNKHYTSSSGNFGWNYHTFGYGMDITFWSRFELAYVCTIFNGDWNPDAETYRQKIIKNQDRHFAAKFQLLKEREFDKEWMPSVAVGFSDYLTGSGNDYFDDNVGATGNGYFNRAYVVTSKHFDTGWGQIGAHIGYQYTRRRDFSATGPIAAVDWGPIWIQNRWFNPRLIIEYDAKDLNVGLISYIWDDHFEAMFALEGCRWINFGLRYNLHLHGVNN